MYRDSKSALKTEFTIQTKEARIKGLAQQLYTLAPRPGAAGTPGPAFISLDSAFKPAAEYDGMAGSLLLEAGLGAAFTEAANDNSAITTAATQSNADMFGEVLSEYLEYREDRQYGQNKGKGSFALGQHKSSCNVLDTDEDEETSAYLADIKQRMHIEQTIATLSQELSALQGAYTPSLELCA